MTRLKISILLLVLTIFSCKKKEQNIDDGGLISPTGKLWMHLHSFIGLNDIDTYGEDLVGNTGRKIRLDYGQYFLTDFQLVKLNDEIYSIDTTIVLKTLKQSSYLLGNVPVGNYKQIRFKLGLSNYYNQMQPTDLLSGELSDTSMWFNPLSFDGNYIYFNTKGMIDTSKDLSNKMAFFDYRIGSNSNLFNIEMPTKNFAIYDGLISYIHLKGNFANLFNGIDLTNENNLKLINTSENQSKSQLVERLKQNIENSFFDFE